VLLVAERGIVVEAGVASCRRVKAVEMRHASYMSECC